MTHFQEKSISSLHSGTDQPGWRKWLYCLALSTILIFFSFVFSSAAQCAEIQTTMIDNEWYVRIIVTTDDGRKDRGNILGRLATSKQGKDGHDLPEMAPPPSPMGGRFLSIVFPHPEWGGDMPDYSSDYRSVPVDPTRGEVWNFQVRTHTPGVKARLSWEGSTAVLGRSRLKNKAGKILVENCAAVTSYALTLNQEGLNFIWDYQGQVGEVNATDKK